MVQVELYADGVNGDGAIRHKVARGRKLIGTENGYMYATAVDATHPASCFTARVIPSHPGLAIPLEADQIFWQR